MASPQQPAPPANPFDGFDNYSAVAQQPVQQTSSPTHQPAAPPNQWGQQQQPMMQQPVPPTMQPMANPPANPYAAAPPANNVNVNPFAVPPPAVAPMAQQQQQPGFGYPQQQPQPQLTLTQQPYQQQPMAQPNQQQLVTMPPNAIVQSPWALQGGAPAAPAPAAPTQSYDPLGIFGAPAPQPPQPPQPPQQQTQHVQQQIPHQQTYQQPGQQPTFQAQQNYSLGQQQPPAQPPARQIQEEVQQFNLDSTPSKSVLPDESEDEGLALIDVELDDDSDANNNGRNFDDRKNDGEFLESNAVKEKNRSKGRRSDRGQNNSWDRNPDIAPPPPMTPGRHHAEYLSQNSASRLSSPLPRQELVHHSGYVLARISFRTVLMRKWKQTFWIQYGPTQLLFFRTFSDYEDWLNNPYHTQKAREFLVKLRVDFVSDLKKASVMGYQVTQVRRKPYGKNVMLHFKLERWMDYGPTIAAAFAAREEEMMNSPTHRRGGDDQDFMNASNDVAALRKIILGCMRNARDAALIATQRAEQSDMAEAVGYRGRYDAEYDRDTRVPTGSGNMGYHQAFSAESSERRRVDPDSPNGPLQRASLATESSLDEDETAEVAPPVVDLLG